MRLIEVMDKASQSSARYDEIQQLSKASRPILEKKLNVYVRHWIEKGLALLLDLEKHLNVNLIPSIVDDEFQKKIDEA
jgi:hypothetical protein